MKINSHCTRYTVSPVPVYGCKHRIGISAMCNLFCLIGMVSYSFDGRVFFEDFNNGVYLDGIILFPSMLDTDPNRIPFLILS